MIKYDKYKDSGVDWLGSVPEQWEVMRVKNITKSLIGGGTPSTEKNEYWDGIIPWVSAKDMKFDRIIDSIDYVTEKAIKESSTNLIKPNRILFVARSGILKHTFPVSINSVAVTINQDLKALEPNRLVSVEYLLRCFKGLSSNILMKCQKVGATVDSIEIQEFLNFPITIPPLHEQTAIATYLDSKTSAIDRKVSLLEQKITHYKQLRKSLINETVCRGLDKNVKLKDSGIEWIGEIPEHWEVRRLKDVGKAIIGITYSPNNIVDSDKEGTLVLRSSNIQNDKLDFGDCVFINMKIPQQLVTKVGDILICSRNGSRNLIGKNICIDEKSAGLTFGAFMTIIRTKSFRYVSCFFNSQIFDAQSGAFMTSTINQLTINTLNNLSIALPSAIEEQTVIATYLDGKTQKIDSIISNIKTQIGTLKELRKTLINDVVTGKIKVTE